MKEWWYISALLLEINYRILGNLLNLIIFMRYVGSSGVCIDARDSNVYGLIFFNLSGGGVELESSHELATVLMCQTS